MRKLAYLIIGFGLGTILVVASACSSGAACPGYQKVDSGSGCRDTATGEFAPAAKCNC